MVEWHLRPAVPGDRAFLFELHCDAMREYVDALWGWDEDEQRERFDGRFDPPRTQIVEVAGEAAGAVVVDEITEEIVLEYVALLSRYRGSGIGTAIVHRLLDRAARARKPLTLRVLRTNPRARALYERLGFRVVRETDERFYMRADTHAYAANVREL
jgi:ribosomal protein S18 acetylase RimI-like enzyme